MKCRNTESLSCVREYETGFVKHPRPFKTGTVLVHERGNDTTGFEEIPPMGVDSLSLQGQTGCLRSTLLDSTV